jgi:hypothetical protein
MVLVLNVVHTRDQMLNSRQVASKVKGVFEWKRQQDGPSETFHITQTQSH